MGGIGLRERRGRHSRMARAPRARVGL